MQAMLLTQSRGVLAPPGQQSSSSSSSSSSRLGLPSGYGNGGLGSLGSAIGSSAIGSGIGTGTGARPLVLESGSGSSSGMGVGLGSGRPSDTQYYLTSSAVAQYRLGSNGPVRPSHPSLAASDQQQLVSNTAYTIFSPSSLSTTNTSAFTNQSSAQAPGAASSAQLNMSSPIVYHTPPSGPTDPAGAHLNLNTAMHRFSSFDSLPAHLRPSPYQSSLESASSLQRAAGTTGLQELPSMGVGNSQSGEQSGGVGAMSPGRRNASMNDISATPREPERERLLSTFKVTAGSAMSTSSGSGLGPGLSSAWPALSIHSLANTPAPAPALEPIHMPAELHASSNDLTSQIMPSTAPAVGGATSNTEATHKHHLHRSFRAGRINSDSMSQRQSPPQADGQSFVSDSRSDVSYGVDQSYESQATFSFVAPAPECCIDKEREVRGTLDVSESVDAFSETLTPRAASALTLALHPPPDALASKLGGDPLTAAATGQQRQAFQRSDSHSDSPLTPRQPDALALAEFQSLSSVVQRRQLSQVSPSVSAYNAKPTSPTGAHIDLTRARVAEALLAREPPPVPQHSTAGRKSTWPSASGGVGPADAQRPDPSAAAAGRNGRVDRLPLQLAPQPPPTLEVFDSRPKALNRTRSVGPQRNSSAHPTTRVRQPPAGSASTKGASTPEATRRAGAEPKAADDKSAIPPGITNSMHRITAALRERHKTIVGISPARPAAKAEVPLGTPPAQPADTAATHHSKRDILPGTANLDPYEQLPRTQSMHIPGPEGVPPSAGDKRFSEGSDQIRLHLLESGALVPTGEQSLVQQTGAVDVLASERARGALKPPALAAGKLQSAQARAKATNAGGDARGSRKVAPTAAPGVHSRPPAGTGVGGGSGGSSQATSSPPSSKELTAHHVLANPSPSPQTAQPQPYAQTYLYSQTQTQTAIGSYKPTLPPAAPAPAYSYSNSPATPTQPEVSFSPQSLGVSPQAATYSYTFSQLPLPPNPTSQTLTSNQQQPSNGHPPALLPAPPNTQPPPTRAHTRAPNVPSVPSQPTYANAYVYTSSGIAADGGRVAPNAAAEAGEEERRSSEYTTSSAAFDDATEASQTWEQLERDQPLVSPRVRAPNGVASSKRAAHTTAMEATSCTRLTPYASKYCMCSEYLSR